MKKKTKKTPPVTMNFLCENPCAYYLGTFKGKRYHRYPVKIKCGELCTLTQDHSDMQRGTVRVVAESARAAADYVARQIGHLACVELTVFGPKYGIACSRYWGWERAIFNGMIQERRSDQQLEFKL